MCTVETRLAEEGIGGFVTLKFWERGSQNNDFSLSTIIYEPHSDAGVSAIAFLPTRGMAVSASYGGDFKVWVSNCGSQQIEKLSQRARWACHAVGSYRKKPMTTAAFSVDGSVLAIAAETFITLWDPEKNVLLVIIGSTRESILNLSFIGESNYLVYASRGSNPQLSVWSMSTLSVFWSYKLDTEACSGKDNLLAFLVIFPESSKIELDGAVVNNDCGAILLFNTGDPVPIASWFVTKAIVGGIAFIKSSKSIDDSMDMDDDPDTTLLAYVNGDHEYALFNPHGTDMNERKIRPTDQVSGLEGTDDVAASNQGMTLISPEMVRADARLRERYLGKLPPYVRSNDITYRTSNPQEPMDAANRPKDPVVKINAKKVDDNKRKWKDHFKNHGRTGPNKRQKVTKAHATDTSTKLGYAGALPKCNMYPFHHRGPCPAQCGNCQKIGHKAQDCKAPTLVMDPNVTITYYECGVIGHFRSECPELRNQNKGRTRENAYAIKGGEDHQNLNNNTDDNNA